MTSTTPESLGVCVIGRTDFSTGIGTVTESALELFARSVPVALFAPRLGASHPSSVQLRSGRVVPVIAEPRGYPIYFYTDVLWNGVSDLHYLHVPKAGLRIAHIAYDSDEFPPEWVTILNDYFDLMLGMTSYLEEVALRSGVTIPVGTLPLGLDLEQQISARYAAPIAGEVRFGTLSAFHERKGLELLVDGFADAFEGSDRAHLTIHSNLAMGSTLSTVRSRSGLAGEGQITISHGDLPKGEKDALLASFDVYVSASAGEGYSIGPREAMAMGKVVVLTDIPPHRELAKAPGVFLIPSIGRAPARYPEIDNRVFGSQALFSRDGVRATLVAAQEYALSSNASADANLRKRIASEFSYTALEPDYRKVIDPQAPVRVHSAGSEFTHIPPSAREVARGAAGRHGSAVGRRKVTVQSHDGGFFSLFNVYASILTWSMQESSPPMVLPDWDVSRLLARTDGSSLVSYCYSRPEDGNMWLSLFEPPYGLTDDDLNDAEFLHDRAELPEARFNEIKEPLLTYSNAYALYRAPWFSRFRQQYNSALSANVHLRPDRQAEVDSIRERMSTQFVVAAHVKHPAHSVEQPGGEIAERRQYVAEVRAALSRRGINEGSDDWGVFLATDQDRVVELFTAEFGDHLIKFEDVTRINTATDLAFDALPSEEQIKDGHQVQHLLAADQSAWSTRFAWEVWRDAEAMAASDVLIHSVSNVATAVSYLGPRVEMVFCEPEGARAKV